MIIKPRHKHVDSHGTCYLPYISTWQAATGNLTALATHLAKVFAADPPVRAKPRGSAVALAHGKVRHLQESERRHSMPEINKTPKAGALPYVLVGVNLVLLLLLLLPVPLTFFGI